MSVYLSLVCIQVMTDSHSPASPGTTSSPHFVFPDMHSSSPSGQYSSVPFMSPIKREVKWETGTPLRSSETDPVFPFGVQQVSLKENEFDIN